MVEISEVGKPAGGEHELLVKVHATTVNRGDRVFGYTEGPFGAHAEYLVIGEDGRVAVIPAALGYQQADPATEGAHYALPHIRRAKISSGHNVLVYGATAAVGSAAVQLLKSFGARVTAVCAGPHLELISKLGADRVIDYTAGDFTRAGADMTWCSTQPARVRSAGVSGC